MARSAVSLEEERFGTDLLLPPGDVRPTPTGDWPTVSGMAALVADVLDRVGTSPGELVHRPEYGAGAEEFVESVGSPAKRAELVSKIRLNLLRDERVGEVGVRFSSTGIVTLMIRPRGQPDAPPERVEFSLQ